jgi:hypothetical protein
MPVQLIALLAALPLLVFWMWMFYDMSKNEHLRSRSRSDWTMAFVVLNIFAAIMYYVDEYRAR